MGASKRISFFKQALRLFIAGFVCVLLTSCGGGGSSDDDQDNSNEVIIGDDTVNLPAVAIARESRGVNIGDTVTLDATIVMTLKTNR